MRLLFLLLFQSLSSASDDLSDTDADTMAQAFMERCIDQGSDDVECREKTISMFGTSGRTGIDVSIQKGIDAKESGGVGAISSKGRRDARSKTVNKSQCTAPNTIYYGGQCHCRLFFDYGDPVGAGCWRCRPKCHRKATCLQKEGCVCQNYTSGDGYRACKTHVPTMLKAYSKADKKTVVVEILPLPWDFPRQAFCKFSNVIIEGALVTNRTIQCLRKTKKKMETKVEVSWDSLLFTHQKMVISDVDESEADFGPIVTCLIVLFILLFVYFGFLYQRKSSNGSSLDDYADSAMQRGKL